MPTPLSKSVTRLSTATDEDGRQLVITLNADEQKLEIKPNGKRSQATVSLPIKTVYRLIRNTAVL
jgi:hypothetical protein